MGEQPGLSLEVRLARTGRWELDGFEAASRFPETVRRAIPENPEDLDGLLGGLLVAVIRFGALVSLAAHFSTEGTREPDVARDLRLLETSWSEGRWLDVWRSAVKVPGPLEGSAWPRAFAIVEEDSTVSIVDGRSGLRTDRIGLISAWVSLRNRLLGHSTLDRAEAVAASREVRRLVSVVLGGLAPAFSAAVRFEARPKGREVNLDVGPGGRLPLSPFVIPGGVAGELLLLDA